MSTVDSGQLPLARIRHWVSARPDQPYLVQPVDGSVRQWTWAQACDEARRIAAWLRAEGARRGWPERSNVAILSKNCAHWILADLAIWMAGYVSVPLYPTLAAHSVRRILEHSGAVTCVVGKLDNFAEIKAGIPAGMPCVATALAPATDYLQWDDLLKLYAPLPEVPERGADELATIIYTSGTTGEPKGVMHDFGSFAQAPAAMRKVFEFGADDRVLSYLPLAHVAERVSVEANSLAAGFCIYFAESPETFVADLKRARPTVFFSVPRLWVKFQQGVLARIPQTRLALLSRIPVVGRAVKHRILSQLGLEHVRFAATGAAPLPESVLTWYRNLGLDLLDVYGMTENFGISHCCRPGQVRVGYVGTPWPGVECRLSGQGEVLTRSRWTMRGYYKAPEATRQAIDPEGWLHTGDLGRIDEQGRLRIVGRVKEIFKTSKGKYVAPAPIENLLGQHPAIEACCVVGAGYPQPFALLMLSADALEGAQRAEARRWLDDSLQQLRTSVNAELDPHERLAFMVVVPDTWTVDSGLVTPTMKIKRTVIESRYSRYFGDWAARGLAVLWADRPEGGADERAA